MINDLKAKIPFGKKTKDEDIKSDEIEEENTESSQDDKTDVTNLSEVQEEEDEGPQSKSLIYKLKKKIQALQKKNVNLASKASADEDASDDNDKVDAEAAKKKKKSKILQIAIGGGLALFLLSDYLIPTEEPIPVPVLKKRSRPNKKVKPPEDTASAQEVKKDETSSTTETPTETPTEIPTEIPTETSVATETGPDSAVTVTSETPAEGALEAKTTDTTPTEASSDVLSETSSQIPIETKPDTTTAEAPVDVTLPEPSTDTPVNVDSVDGEETKVTSDETITDQILEDLEKQAKETLPVAQKKEYVSPPDYEYQGRGLVYNCQGKHWACVDAPSYKICEDNASSVKYLKKKTECHPYNVYETPKGCESMQNRMVSSSYKTEFCAD
jgi:hypothetical protein